MKRTISRRLNAVLLTLALALSLAAPAWASAAAPTVTVTLSAGEGFPEGSVGSAGSPGVLLDGGGGQLTAKAEGPSLPGDPAIHYTYNWESGDDKVVTVTGRNERAGVAAVGVGTTTITVSVMAEWTETGAGGTSVSKSASGGASFTVTVKPVLVTGIKVSPDTLSLAKGSSKSLSVTVSPGNATYSSVTWSSDTPSVATVDTATGKVTGAAVGTATITATTVGVDADNNHKYSSCVVTVTPEVIPATGVTLSAEGMKEEDGKKTLQVQAGKTASLTATVEPEEATNKAVTWLSSNSNVATVNKDGLVTGKRAGTVTITAATTDGRYSDTCTVTVTAAASSGVTISSGKYTEQNPLYLDIGTAAVKLIASVEPQGANQSVTWKSGDTGVAKVDSEGNVTAVGVGKTTITATSVSDTSKSSSCPVEVSGVLVKGIPTTMSLNRSAQITLDTIGNAKTNLKKSWTSTNPAVAAVDGKDTLTARGIGTATITLTCTSSNGTRYPVEPSTFTVTVAEDAGAIYYGSATAGAPYVFSDIMSGLNSICLDTTGYRLSYITNVMVPTKEGVLYYNHVSSDDTGFGVGATERYYYEEGGVGQRYMSGLTFVPNSEFNGETTITFTACNTQGKTYNGKVRLTVSGSGNVTFITKAGQPLIFSSANFSAASRSETGRDVSGVSFTLPDESKGTLYYGITGSGQYRYEVTEQEEYYRSRTPYLDQTGFIPAEYYIGTLRLSFRGTDTAGVSFTGRLYIIVVPNRPDGQRSELTTTVLRGTAVDFGKFNFNAVCREIVGETLSYVRFTPPSASAGTLYYNYTSSGTYDSLVNANTRYYYSRTPKLTDLTFVPSAGRIEPVSIGFVGYSSSGKSFDGTVTIYYRDGEGGGDVISYAVTSGQAIPFEPADFNDLCRNATGKDLNRVVFQYLPDTWQGTLYYNFDTGSSTGTKVTTKTNLYRSGSPRLSSTAFAPRSDFTGTVDLEFVGYSVGGDRFTGTVEIKVEEGNTTLRYSALSGSSVSFDADDFNNICVQATGGKLNYVRFQLPKSTQGKLYYRYNSSSSSKGTVSSSSNYYYSTSGSNRVDNVFFTAASNYTGTVSIGYTGFSTSGARFTGTVEVDVAYHYGTVLSYDASALPFTIPGSDLVSACDAALERDLSYVVINALPKEGQGRLYYDYSGYGTGTEVKTSTKYYPEKSPYLTRLVFVAKAGYSGVVSLPYTAYDIRGGTVSGSVDITVTQAATSAFSDMSRFVWAIPSVDFLYTSGIVVGDGNSHFYPQNNVKRGDFVLMISRMYNLKAAGTKSFSDVPEDSYYARYIASAKAQGVIKGENGMFYPDEPITRQDAMVFLRNAMRAGGRSVPAGTTEELNSFADYNSVDSSARSAVMSMIHMGILKGDDYRRINPNSPITRAETASILHRAMTV